MPVPIPNLQQLQINPPQPATMRLQAMGMQNELSRIGIAKDHNAIAREGMALDKEQFEFNKKQAIFAKSRDYISSLEREEFPKYKEWLNKLFSELFVTNTQTSDNSPLYPVRLLSCNILSKEAHK